MNQMSKSKTLSMPFKFEKLDVWKKSHDLTLAVFIAQKRNMISVEDLRIYTKGVKKYTGCLWGFVIV